MEQDKIQLDGTTVLDPREEWTCNNIDVEATTQQLQVGEIGAQEFNDLREDIKRLKLQRLDIIQVVNPGIVKARIPSEVVLSV